MAFDLGPLLAQITRAKRRNKDLSTRLAQVEKSRDKWKARALECSGEKERQRKKLATWRERNRKYTAEQWRQHDLIVARIRSLPKRDIRDT